VDSALLLTIPGLGYCVASGLSLLRLERGTEGPARLRSVLIYASVLVHAIVLGARIVHAPASPLSSVRESVVLISLLMVVAYLVTARFLRGEGIAALVLFLVGGAVLVVASTLPATPQPIPSVLQSPWLWLHVPLCLLGFLACVLAGSAAAMYLIVSHLLKKRRAIAIWPSMPTLDSLERFAHRMAELGFPLLTAGLATGMMWADSVWGHPFQASPKQVLAALTWIIYVIYFHVRDLRGMRGRRCAWLLVAGVLAGVAGYIVAATRLGPHSFI
jgi:ABC-type transport system involved in cytochrome c biogenesis permease subunit